MADPVLVNRKPLEGATGVSPESPILFGLRDVDTRVDLPTAYMATTYSRLLYRAAALPLIDPALAVGDGEAKISFFNDAVSVTPPATTAIFSLTGTPALHIEKSIGGEQKSFLFVHDSLVGDGPVSVETTLDLATTTASNPAHAYYDTADHTGMVFGMVNWRKQVGVYLLFMDDGVSKTIHVRGQATSAAGARILLANWAFDWSAASFRYRIVWDDTPGRRGLYIFATDGTTESKVVIPSSTMDIMEAAGFLAGTVIAGTRVTGVSEDKITAVVGNSSPTGADAINVETLDVAGYGRALMIAGEPTGDATLLRATNESQVLSGALTDDELDEWFDEGTGTIARSGSSLLFTREDADGVDDLYRWKDEPDVVSEEWLLVGTFSATEISHSGSEAVWAGFYLADTTNEFNLSLLDDFTDKRIGLWKGSGTGSLTTDFYASGVVDWTLPTTIALLGSATGGFVRGHINGAATPDFDSGGYPGAGFSAVSAESELRAGFIRNSGIQHSGAFSLGTLWFFPNATFAEPADGLPDAGPFAWTVATAGAPVSAVVSGRYEIDSATAGDWIAYSQTSADYDDEAGAWVYLAGKVEAWTDVLGASDPKNSQIGPVAMLPYSTKGINLEFVETNLGTRYVYIPGNLITLSDVIAQNANGQLVSAPIDFTTDHSYMVVMKFFSWVRVYIDHASTPAIDIPWASLSQLERPAHLAVLAAGTYVLFGSLDDEAGMDVSLSYARGGYGEGYDISALHNIDEDTLVARVYGSDVDVLTDFEDV